MLQTMEDLEDSKNRVFLDLEERELDSTSSSWVPTNYLKLLELRKEIEEEIKKKIEDKVVQSDNETKIVITHKNSNWSIKGGKKKNGGFYSNLEYSGNSDKNIYLTSQYMTYSSNLIKALYELFVKNRDSMNLFGVYGQYSKDDFVIEDQFITNLSKRIKEASVKIEEISKNSDTKTLSEAIQREYFDLTKIILNPTKKEESILDKSFSYWKDKTMMKSYSEVKYYNNNIIAVSFYKKYFEEQDGQEKVSPSKICLIILNNPGYEGFHVRRLNNSKNFNPESNWDSDKLSDIIDCDISNTNIIQSNESHLIFRDIILEKEPYSIFSNKYYRNAEKIIYYSIILEFGAEDILRNELENRVRDDKNLEQAKSVGDIFKKGFSRSYSGGYMVPTTVDFYNIRKKHSEIKVDLPQLVKISQEKGLKENIKNKYTKEQINYYKKAEGYQRMTKKLRKQIYRELAEFEIIGNVFERLPPSLRSLSKQKINQIKEQIEKEGSFRVNLKVSKGNKTEILGISENRKSLNRVAIGVDNATILNNKLNRKFVVHNQATLQALQTESTRKSHLDKKTKWDRKKIKDNKSELVRELTLEPGVYKVKQLKSYTEPNRSF